MQSCPGQKYTAVIVGLIFYLATQVLSEKGDSKRIKTFVLPDDNQETFEAHLIVVTWRNKMFGDVRKCNIITDESSVDETLKRNSGSKILTMDREDFLDLLEDCKEVASRNSKETRAETTTMPETMEAGTTEGYDGWNVIFPGTKWCGAGDIAKNYDDLGLSADTDKCCRAHDLCNDTMAPGQTKNGLTNDSKFTKLSCQCDDDFYDCLDRVDSVISNKIGNIYFNILRRDCYKFDYPVTKKCKKYRSFLKITCKEYEKNISTKKVYQWVKPKTYKKLPMPGPLTITLPF